MVPIGCEQLASRLDALEGAANLPALTKRELFAAMAMQGYLSNPSHTDPSTKDEFVGKWSADMADALLAALEAK